MTATGAIIEVNQNSYPDLYFALRSGGNNFGIVTRFDLYTYPQGLMWGSSLLYDITQSDAIFNAYVDYGNNAPSDPNAALILAYVYAQGQFLVIADLEYALPSPIPRSSTTSSHSHISPIHLQCRACPTSRSN